MCTMCLGPAYALHTVAPEVGNHVESETNQMQEPVSLGDAKGHPWGLPPHPSVTMCHSCDHLEPLRSLACCFDWCGTVQNMWLAQDPSGTWPAKCQQRSGGWSF